MKDRWVNVRYWPWSRFRVIKSKAPVRVDFSDWRGEATIWRNIAKQLYEASSAGVRRRMDDTELTKAWIAYESKAMDTSGG